MEILFFPIVAAAIYLIPTVIALARKHTYRGAIVIANMVGGVVGVTLWVIPFISTVIGGQTVVISWLAALVWCFADPQKPESAVTDTDRKAQDDG